MNILIIGGAGTITDAILEKFNKEGHKLYVLTGNNLKVQKYKHVFEHYRFSYDSNSIKEIFESIKPDVTIFMGAYDSNFSWNNPREDAVKYSAGLLNILMGYALVKCGRFVYLSSQEVFGRSQPNDITETMETYATDFRSMVILQGEEVCSNYNKMDELDIVVIRLDNLCAVPAVVSEARDVCSRMCINALKKGRIEGNSNKKFSLLYISDAAEYIHRIVKSENLKYALYHISSSNEISEMELAQKVKEYWGDEFDIVDNTLSDNYRVILSNDRLSTEFDCKIHKSNDEIVKLIVSYIRKRRQRFLSDGSSKPGLLNKIFRKAKGVFAALLPFIENMICFIPFFMLNNRAVGSQFFNRLDFYLLYVLLFAIVHGQQQATFSAMLATAGYCFRQMYTRSGFEVMLDYNTYIWVAQLFILGLAVGYLRDRLSIIKKEDKEEINYLTGQVGDIQDINYSNVRIKNVLEEQIINHNQSIGTIYEITSELDKYAPEEVLFYAAEVVGRILNTEDVAIYRVDNDRYARLFSATSKKARSLGNSIIYTQMDELYDDLKSKKVYINKMLKAEHPLLANAIYENDSMQIMIFAWGIPWEHMHLATANMMKVVGYLIQNAVLRANSYQKALEKERYQANTKVLEKEAFKSLVKAYMDAEDKGLVQCSLLRISGNSTDSELAAGVERVVRGTDYIGDLGDGYLYVLLVNTDREGANLVIGRFASAGYEAIYQEDYKI